MGRAPCCDKSKVKKGPWSPQEDALLKSFIERFGNGGNWISLPKKAGLNRCGKSCRLRWLNYLRPNIKHGDFTEEEDYVISSLYNTIGSRWSVIAKYLPGRTDNDVKNYWNTKLKKKLLRTCEITNKDAMNYPNYKDSVVTTSISPALEVSSSISQQDVSSHNSGASSSNSDLNSSISIVSSVDDHEDGFWMNLLSGSFDDDVVLVSRSQLVEKINEIALFLDV
ncbi:hypothetical protein Cgig2_028126 [Carnegiea gigantea]|uniref:Uncharacterized protein n=1 Tax=Carnegiea gigantea TaxID=171969 RepID=A0A9Q1KIK9_9CARY|nr:hypothetical protein Cgig2_028126 [Carnegiea gigantea]